LVVEQDAAGQASTRRSVATLLDQFRQALSGRGFAGDEFETIVVEVSLRD
jgi:hypothetical protein